MLCVLMQNCYNTVVSIVYSCESVIILLLVLCVFMRKCYNTVVNIVYS